MRGKRPGLAFFYLIAGAVMLGVMIVFIVLGHLLVAGFAFVAGIAATLSAAGCLLDDQPQDPDQ